MRKTLALAIAFTITAAVAGAQKVMMPSQTNNPNIKISPVSAEEQALASAKRIKRDEALKLVAANKAVFVDVRSLDSFNRKHIKGAVSIPGSQLPSRMREVPPGKMAITYCACVEEHTAARAVLQMKSRGNTNAAALIGGWNEWVALGLPTEGRK
ncbi:MAG: rhodanese-like domain-containing protein [Thermoanaerobaculia bacterium]|nr:rhodanese-like domain-containing protein [Thermoanaerobaculia bacterium]